MNILLVSPEYPDTFWSFKHALKFVSKKVANPPLGLLTIAAMLPVDWQKRLIDLNCQQLTESDLQWADYVLISAMDIQRQSVNEIVAQCKQHGKTMIAGGPLFTGEYLRFPDIDHFILNEGEITLPLFLKDLEDGHPRRVYTTDQFADIQTTPIPLWHLLNFNNYDAMAIQLSRGCPYNCDFCNVTALLGHKPRLKSVFQIIAELDSLYQLGWRRNIFFVDDNFIGNKRFIKEKVLPALIEWRKGKTGCLFLTEASINLADDEQLMTQMADAGFTSVFIGIESPAEESLMECRKSQNTRRDLLASVKRIQNHGLQVMGGFIVGFDSDGTDIFQRQIDFIQESGIVTAMVGLLQAPYGTQLYQRLKAEHRILDEMSGDNTDGTTNIISKMDPAELFNGYRYLISKLYNPTNFYQRIKTLLTEFHPRKMTVNMEWNEWLAFLRSILLMGILGPERSEYWKLFFWTLLRHPSQLPLAITLAIYGYHFRTISGKILTQLSAQQPTLGRYILAKVETPAILRLKHCANITWIRIKSMRLSAKSQSQYVHP